MREGDCWVPCEVVEERIRVKGGSDIVERVLITPRGPIVSPALEGITTALSMRTVWLDPLPTRGLIDVHKVTTFEEFRGTFREWPVTPQHFVYADTSGTIGWQLTGEAPVRKRVGARCPDRGRPRTPAGAGLFRSRRCRTQSTRHTVTT